MQLTPTEQEILKLLSQGYTYKEIATKRNVTIDSVKKHCNSTYSKLQVSNKVLAINKWKEINNV